MNFRFKMFQANKNRVAVLPDIERSYMKCSYNSFLMDTVLHLYKVWLLMI